MRKLLFIVFLLPFAGFAQISQNIDSLLQLLETTKGAQKVDVLNTLAFLHHDTAFDKTIEYATRANKTAIDYFTKAVDDAKENNQKALLKDSYEGLANAWAALNNYEKAFTFNKLFHLLKDSLVNIETHKQISEIKTKYETEKTGRENTLLKSKNEIAGMQLKIKNKTIFILFVAIVLCAVFIGIIMIEYNKKQKAYNYLVKQNLLLAKTEVEFAIRDEIEEVKTEGLKTGELSNANESDLIRKIEDLMLEEKPFLFSGITLDEICQKLNTNRTYLSNVINTHFGKNFNEYINEYRIKVARQLLADPDNSHFSIEGIGQMAGFNSRSTFFSCFKKATGITPSYFRNSVRAIKS